MAISKKIITSHSRGFAGLRCATPRKPLNFVLEIFDKWENYE